MQKKNKNALTRYRLIDNRMTIRQKTAPSLQELVDYVSEKMGAPISVASIQKDIYAMRYDESLGFNAPIEYDMYKKGFKYIYLKDETIGNVLCEVVDLVPEKKDAQFFIARMML